MAWTNFAAGIFTAGQILTAAQMNTYVRDNITAGGPCFLRVRRNTLQTTATGAIAAINYDTEDVDTAGIFTASSNRIIVATAGLYQMSANVAIGTNATGVRGLLIFASSTVSGATDAATVTGGTRIAGVFANAASGVQTSLNCSTLYSVTAGQAFSVGSYQTCGGNLTIGNPAEEQTAFSIAYVGAV